MVKPMSESESIPVSEEVDGAKPSQEPPEPAVDLAAEASQVAAKDPPTEDGKIRSLDDLDVDGGVRAQIESYVSKSVNDAIAKHDVRQTQKLDDEGYMNKAQIEQLLAEKDAEYSRREDAKETFLTTLGQEGVSPGSEEYAKIQSFYKKAVDSGQLTPHILLSEAGIRTLVALSGVSSVKSEAPQSGLARSAPAPDGSVSWGDGTIQLNAQTSPEGKTLDQRMRDAVSKAVVQSPD